jgi:DNA polymerase-3 subunit delta
MASVSLEQFFERLKKGKPVGGIVLLGAEAYLRDLCRAALVEAFVPEGARDWGVVRLSLADASLSRVLQEAESMPMLVPRKLLFVSDLEELEQLDDEPYERAVQALDTYLSNPAPFTVLVLEAASLDQRMKLYKALSRHALVVACDLAPGGNESERAAAVLEAAKQMTPNLAREIGVSIERDAADALVEILNGELARIRTELQKLAAYVGEGRRITVDDVDALVVSSQRYTVWQLSDMLATRRRDLALEFLDGLLREGEQPAQIVGALAWMLRKLLEAQEASPHMSKWQAAGYFKMRPDTAELALRQARRIPRGQLLRGLAALYEADSRLKSGPPDDRAVMEFLVSELTA